MEISQYRDQVYEALQTVPNGPIVAAVDILREAHRRQANVFVLCSPADGGDTEHIAQELAKGIEAGPFAFHLVRLFGKRQPGLAWDAGWAYEDVYTEQMRGRVQPGDVVIAISRQGQALGTLRALRTAKRTGATTIAMVGFDGGELKDAADICLHVRSGVAEQVEDVQTVLAHMLCAGLRGLVGARAPAQTEALPQP